MRALVIRTFLVASAIGWAAGKGMPHIQATSSATTPGATSAAATTTAAPEYWQVPHASPGTVVLTKGWEGHYFTDADVAGRSLNFIVDTGATTVALSREQARSVGVDVDRLTYDRSVETASGTTRAAMVTLPQLRIGDIQLLDVSAVVMDMPGDVALLGQSFLGRIDKVSIEGDKMTLTKL